MDVSYTTCEEIITGASAKFISFHILAATTSVNASIVVNEEASCETISLLMNFNGVFYSTTQGDLKSCGRFKSVDFMSDIAKHMCNFECKNLPIDGRQFQDITMRIAPITSHHVCDVTFVFVT